MEGVSTSFHSFSVCRASIDLGFLIDGCRSRRNFRRIIRFVKRLVNSFVVSTKKARVGVMLYTSRAIPRFRFNRYRSTSSVIRAIRRIRYKRGRRYTGRALHFVKRYLFGGKRQCGRKRVLIVLTDGRSRDKVQKPAVALQKAGVEVFIVGVGSSCSKRQMLQIASDSSHTIRASFRTLSSLVEVIRKKSCSGNRIEEHNK